MDWLALVPKTESGLASRMAELTGIRGVKPRTPLVLVPYAAGGAETGPADPGDPFFDGSSAFGSVGLDLRRKVGSSFALDATVNPDFGQVEVDPAVVNLTDFETFFPEKRPFFVEGAQIFDNFGRNGANNYYGFMRTEPDLFYTRRIGRAPQGYPEAEFVVGPAGHHHPRRRQAHREERVGLERGRPRGGDRARAGAVGRRGRPRAAGGRAPHQLLRPARAPRPGARRVRRAR